MPPARTTSISISDLGHAYLGLGVVLVWAAARSGRQLVLAAAAGATVADIPHLVLQLLHAGDLPVGDAVVEGALLAAVVMVGVGMLLVGIGSPVLDGSADQDTIHRTEMSSDEE